MQIQTGDCTINGEISKSSVPLTDLLVVGGDNKGDALDTVESISTDSSLPHRRSLSNFPVKIWGAAGATLGDASLPYICGGEDEDYNDRNECWAYNPQNDMWGVSTLQREARSFSGSATHPDHGWVISGGYGGDRGSRLSRYLELHRLSSAEQTKDGKIFQSFASLPLPLARHCLVSLGKGGGRGDLFLTGGDRTGSLEPSKKAFIYDAGSWREMADMPTARWGKECAKFRLIQLDLVIFLRSFKYVVDKCSSRSDLRPRQEPGRWTG